MPDPLILLGAALGGLAQGLSGFALGLVCTVFWAGALPPTVAAPLIVLSSIAGQALSIRGVLPALQWRRAAPMVAAGVLGVPLGVLVLPWVEVHAFRLGVGILLCLYCPLMLAARRLPRIAWGGTRADMAAGLLGGAMGGLAGLGGPAPTLWITLRGWPRDEARATFQAFLITTQAASVVSYAASGLLTLEVGRLLLWTLPCVLLPSWIGSRLYRHIPAELFRRMILGLLLLTGVALVVRG